MRAMASLLALSTCGCGLLASGTTTRVPVTSEPIGVDVWVDGVHVGQTPVRVSLASDQTHTVELRKPGMVSRAFRLRPVIEASYLVLDLATVFVGLLIDAATGGYYELRPARLEVALSPDPRGIPPPEPVPEDAAALSAPPAPGAPGRGRRFRQRAQR